jgi:hypothetical protein
MQAHARQVDMLRCDVLSTLLYFGEQDSTWSEFASKLHAALLAFKESGRLNRMIRN